MTRQEEIETLLWQIKFKILMLTDTVYNNRPDFKDENNSVKALKTEVDYITKLTEEYVELIKK